MGQISKSVPARRLARGCDRPGATGRVRPATSGVDVSAGVSVSLSQHLSLSLRS